MSFFEDLRTFFAVRLFNLSDFLLTAFRYYFKPKFALIDISLLLSYFFKSPYRIAREFKESEPYGETPHKTLAKIVKACPITLDDVVLELGAGRGRSCFWLAFFQPCKKVIGIEYIPDFVTKAQSLARFFNVQNVEFRCEDMCKSKFNEATWIYLFGTALDDATIKQLITRFDECKPGTKVITISYALTEYAPHSKIKLLNTIEVEFAWGKTECYIHQIG